MICRKKIPPIHGEVDRGPRPLLRVLLRLVCVLFRGWYKCSRTTL